MRRCRFGFSCTDDRYIVFVPTNKIFSDSNVTGNHIAVGSYLQIIEWVFFGFTRLDTISYSVQLDMDVSKDLAKWTVDGVEVKNLARVTALQNEALSRGRERDVLTFQKGGK